MSRLVHLVSDYEIKSLCLDERIDAWDNRLYVDSWLNLESERHRWNVCSECLSILPAYLLGQ